MNRYAGWKYALIALVLMLSFIYTLPNFFGESPAIQVSSIKLTAKVNTETWALIDKTLAEAKIAPESTYLDGQSLRLRFKQTEMQLRAKDIIEQVLNKDPAQPAYIVALNLLPRTPAWLQALHASPMYLGLDLRGGVHFMLQVDMTAAVQKRVDALSIDVQTSLKEKALPFVHIERQKQSLYIRVKDTSKQAQIEGHLLSAFADVDVVKGVDAQGPWLALSFKPFAQKTIQEQALKQNITTLHNRINELGVAEPILQQQGSDRIVVQLPGVQDTAKAKEILGRTATLEMRMVDESMPARAAEIGVGPLPEGAEKYTGQDGAVVIVKKEVILTGDNLNDAQAGFDQQTQAPAVHLSLDPKGTRIFRDITTQNVGKRMAILLFEKGKGEVVTAPVIQSPIDGGRVQISGHMSTAQATDVALLLRSGSLAAPMEIIEERTIGPSLGAENIAKGIDSVMWGFLAVVIFMSVYYLFFGLISSVALGVNLVMMVAVLSMLQATLTLPGMAAMALTLGMAIDANVLINERIREELRHGASAQSAIHAGYDRAWGTILDSNITTLIAGVALLIFGSGPVRGFAVVHCIGILTSMFSAVVFSRGLVNLWYGSRKKLTSLSIGTVWKPSLSNESSVKAHSKRS